MTLPHTRSDGNSAVSHREWASLTQALTSAALGTSLVLLLVFVMDLFGLFHWLFSRNKRTQQI